MVKLVRIAFLALAAILLALALGSCNKQPGDKQDPDSTTARSTAVPVAESASDAIPDVEDDDPLVTTADDEESEGEGTGDDSDGDAEDDADDGDDGDDGDDEGGQEQPSDGDGASGIVIPPPPDERPVDVEALYGRSCSGCHGDDLGGASSGPPLKDVAQLYGAAELKLFLDDPSAYAANDRRLIELGQQYGIAMPPAKFRPAEMEALAAWLLAK
jgi:cytochrome c551/c552